ncbi:MAG: catalase [Bdellovibrionales bacterium]
MKAKIILILGVVFLCSSTLAFSIVYTSTLDFELYKNERYLGNSKATELASVIDVGLRVLAAQRRLSGDQPRRVFHTKQHGCLTGRLRIRSERPNDGDRVTFAGLFDGQRQEYDVLVRFSNGLGVSRRDSLPAVRGVAIKVFDVENRETKRHQTVDLLMTNSPIPAGRDLLEFADFMDSVSQFGPTLGLKIFSLSHKQAAEGLVQATGLLPYKVRSLATIRYWGGHPYLMGPERAMKFSLIPTETTEKSVVMLKLMGENFLRKDLLDRTRSGQLIYTFAVQMERSPEMTPIENNLREWLETDSPSIAVADLILDRQDFSQADQDQVCEDLRFTPGHYIPDHRPLSNMGRGRLFAYEASQIGRRSQSDDPGPELVHELRLRSKVRREPAHSTHY